SFLLKTPCLISVTQRNRYLGKIKDTPFVQRERFDYTNWQREYFDKMDLQTFVDKASAYTKENGK
ncbi:MAG: hypothetical protein IKS97_11135, partial [Fibrobacter sp.]|nr:hypothetical protein [Fibrobacter sp.]